MFPCMLYWLINKLLSLSIGFVWIEVEIEIVDSFVLCRYVDVCPPKNDRLSCLAWLAFIASLTSLELLRFLLPFLSPKKECSPTLRVTHGLVVKVHTIDIGTHHGVGINLNFLGLTVLYNNVKYYHRSDAF